MLFLRCAILSFLVAISLAGQLAAQELRMKSGNIGLRAAPAAPALEPDLRVMATPSTHWLDFQRLAANRWIPGDLPAWLEPVVVESGADETGAAATLFRLKFRGLTATAQQIQMRLFFDDVREIAPKISAFSAAGALLFTCGPLGTGLGLPTSETLSFPTAGVDFLELRVAGDGRNVRGVFLALLASQQIQHAADFDAPADVADAFGNAPAVITRAEDQALFGRVRAMLDPGETKLSQGSAARGAWEFPLEAPPLLAIVTFEILNADGLAPLDLTLNERPLGPVGVHWPDLADPGYLGLSRPLEKDLRFRYTGWLRCQKVVPGSALRAGLNTLALQLHPDAAPLAIRAVELHLKYNWKSLDYTLSPTSP